MMPGQLWPRHASEPAETTHSQTPKHLGKDCLPVWRQRDSRRLQVGLYGCEMGGNLLNIIDRQHAYSTIQTRRGKGGGLFVDHRPGCAWLTAQQQHTVIRQLSKLVGAAQVPDGC